MVKESDGYGGRRARQLPILFTIQQAGWGPVLVCQEVGLASNLIHHRASSMGSGDQWPSRPNVSKNGMNQNASQWQRPTVMRFLLRLLLLTPSLLAPSANAQQSGMEKDAARWITPPTDKAIRRGLAWLASRQHEDGSLGIGRYYRGDAAVVGLTGMAMISRRKFAQTRPVRCSGRACSRLHPGQRTGERLHLRPGYESEGPMYGHGFATLFLAECLGSSSRPEVREKLTKAVKLLVNTQNAQGSWRYKPERIEGDLSVTIAEVIALRAARNAGVHVPKETIERSVDFIKKCQNPDGGFVYRLSERGPSQFPRSAAALAGLFRRDLRRAGNHQGTRLFGPVRAPTGQCHTRTSLLSLRSLLCRHGHMASRRQTVDQVVPGHP